MDFQHITVLREETIANLLTDPKGIYVDCTLGGAGHTQLLLERLEMEGRIVGFDQDLKAVEHARELFKSEERITIIERNFEYLEAALKELNVLPVNGIVFDLGVSSPQLDEAERGFSYMQNAHLDMRMDTKNQLTARDIVNQWTEEEISKVIWEYGEERWARRIAKFIVQRRLDKSLETTGELVDVIKAAVPASARRDGPHPAKRTFQALRIAVNDELGVLERALDQSLRCLGKGGRLAVITFHSLEDRIVKQKMQSWLGRCTCPPELPVCRCGASASARLITRKPIQPSEEELERNPRSRSAKLRVAEKTVEQVKI